MKDIKDHFWVIVLRGELNPAIFQPLWFVKNGLIGENEGSSAQIEVVHRDISRFRLEWLQLEVLRDKFLVRTLEEGREEELRDFILGTFKLLRHTPIYAMGINYVVHFSVESIEDWHAIGHKLAPKKDIWDKILTEPGTEKVIIRGKRPDQYQGCVRVQVGPSPIITPGLFVDINDHFTHHENNMEPSSTWMDILSAEWSNSTERSRKIANAIKEIEVEE
jgi:hypothetical protein